jgi:flagellar biogenesis protein FliO
MLLQEPNMQTFNWAQFFASSIGIALLLLAALWWVRRQKNVSGMGVSERHIQIVEAMPLSLKHKMVLLQIDDQMILTSVSPAEVKTLHAWRKEQDHAE